MCHPSFALIQKEWILFASIMCDSSLTAHFLCAGTLYPLAALPPLGLMAVVLLNSSPDASTARIFLAFFDVIHLVFR
jgi:hypothetical protein